MVAGVVAHLRFGVGAIWLVVAGLLAGVVRLLLQP